MQTNQEQRFFLLIHIGQFPFSFTDSETERGLSGTGPLLHRREISKSQLEPGLCRAYGSVYPGKAGLPFPCFQQALCLNQLSTAQQQTCLDQRARSQQVNPRPRIFPKGSHLREVLLGGLQLIPLVGKPSEVVIGPGHEERLSVPSSRHELVLEDLGIFIRTGQRLVVVVRRPAQLAFGKAYLSQKIGSGKHRGIVAAAFTKPVTLQAVLPRLIHIAREELFVSSGQKIGAIHDVVLGEQRAGLLSQHEHAGDIFLKEGQFCM